MKRKPIVLLRSRGREEVACRRSVVGWSLEKKWARKWVPGTWQHGACGEILTKVCLAQRWDRRQTEESWVWHKNGTLSIAVLWGGKQHTKQLLGVRAGGGWELRSEGNFISRILYSNGSNPTVEGNNARVSVKQWSSAASTGENNKVCRCWDDPYKSHHPHVIEADFTPGPALFRSHYCLINNMQCHQSEVMPI